MVMMLMKKRAADALAKYFKDHMRVGYNPTLSPLPPLVLTDRDKISVGELRKMRDCPVITCLEGLEDTKEVFFRRKGKRWVFAHDKDFPELRVK